MPSLTSSGLVAQVLERRPYPIERLERRDLQRHRSCSIYSDITIIARCHRGRATVLPSEGHSLELVGAHSFASPMVHPQVEVPDGAVEQELELQVRDARQPVLERLLFA